MNSLTTCQQRRPLEQRHPHLPQRVADVLLGQAATAAQALDDAESRLESLSNTCNLERSAGTPAGAEWRDSRL